MRILRVWWLTVATMVVVVLACVFTPVAVGRCSLPCTNKMFEMCRTSWLPSARGCVLRRRCSFGILA